MPTTPATTDAAVQRVERRGRPSLLLTAAAVVALGSWVASAVVMSTRGVDLTDESFYLLSYRWWDSNPRNFSGAQYLFGPVFEALGHDVASLRLARLVLLLAAHGVFVLALRDHLRRTARPPWAWSTPVMVLVLATGGISYGWLPQSPGYNDVALLGSLLIGAVALRCATATSRGTRLSSAWPLLAGSTLTAVALAKWSSALAVGVLTAAVITILLRRDPVGLLRAAVAGLLGIVAFVVLFHLTVAPWDEVLPPMRDVNRLVSGDTNSPSALLLLYATSTGWVLLTAALSALAGLLPTWCLRRLPATTSRPPGLVVGALVAAVPAAAALPWLVSFTLPQGGTGATWTYTVSIVAALLASLAATLLLPDEPGSSPRPSRDDVRPDRVSRWSVAVLLLGLPAAQAFGTGNALYLVAIHGLTFWVAGALLGIADHPGANARRVGTSLVTTCALLVAVVATTGLTIHPYRADPIDQATATVPGSDNLAGVEVDPVLAARLGALISAVDQQAPGGRPVYAVDELAGLVLALDRPPAGESWNSRLDPERAAAGLLAYCKRDSEVAAPIILADRPLGQSELETLQACGWPLYPAYRAFSPPGGPDGVRLYVPDREEANR